MKKLKNSIGKTINPIKNLNKMDEKWQTLEFLKEELEEAKKALFSTRSIREVRAIQHRIFYLEQMIRNVKR